MFQTLQSRLPIELRLAGITDIDSANKFLDSYIDEFNAKFALPVDSIKSVFETQPDDEKINLTLAVLMERTVDSGHCIRYNNKHYKMVDKYGMQAHYLQGTKVLLIKAFDKKMYCTVNGVTRVILMSPEQQELFPRPPGEGQGLGQRPKHNKSPGKTRANVLIISGHSQKCLT